MRRPRLTVRTRLTALYAALVALSTGALLIVSYWLLARHFDRTLPEALARDALDEVALQYVIAFVGVLLVAGAVGWAVAGRVLAPLKRMSSAARRIDEQRIDERIPVSGPEDELRELGETLNSMLGRLAVSFDTQRRFVANASHELRSPLTVIRSEAEVALANPEPDVDELRAMAESVVQASRRTEALLASLLILARSQRGLMSTGPVDLAAVAAAAAGSAADAAEGEGVRIATEVGPAAVAGEAALLERLAANLIENAVRYNRPGGFVHVRTREGIGSAELRVENSGPPVSREDAARLAEPFERVSREADHRGAGLGLSIVRAVSEAHGGTLLIEPRAEGGLVVAVRLPRAPAAPPSGRARATDSRPSLRASA